MLELQDICFQVQEDSGEKGILKHVDLKIEDNFTAITGPNGGGKSTMAKVIAGIIKPIDQIQNRQSFKADRLLKRKADPLPGAFRNGQIRARSP